MDPIELRPIGVIHSPFAYPEGMPIQPVGAEGATGIVEVAAEYAQGLKDLDGFSHIMLVYHFHKSTGYRLLVKPFLDDQMRGVFATRAPSRPNPIGISVVRLERIEGCRLHVSQLDVIDGTPLLDIKPYVPQFDHPEGARLGWLSTKVGRASNHRSDTRFG